MFNDIIVGVLIVICVLTGIWGWWMENGPERNNKEEGSENESAEETEER